MNILRLKFFNLALQWTDTFPCFVNTISNKMRRNGLELKLTILLIDERTIWGRKWFLGYSYWISQFEESIRPQNQPGLEITYLLILWVFVITRLSGYTFVEFVATWRMQSHGSPRQRIQLNGFLEVDVNAVNLNHFSYLFPNWFYVRCPTVKETEKMNFVSSYLLRMIF